MTKLVPPSSALAPLAAAVVPAALAIAGCLLVRPEPASLLAPWLGPWAGIAYGHGDCTLGNAAPAWAWIGTAAFVLAGFGAWRTRRSPRRWVRRAAIVLLAAAAVDWFALAWLSAVNTTS